MAIKEQIEWLRAELHRHNYNYYGIYGCQFTDYACGE